MQLKLTAIFQNRIYINNTLKTCGAITRFLGNDKGNNETY
jgi:hypothetical protein